MIDKMIQYGKKCCAAKYISVGNDSDYAIERDGDTLYLMFQWSVERADWKYNFDFPATPYKDMGIPWKCHRGFLAAWKSIEPYVVELVLDPTIKHIIVVGYSHGAAIATLAHEYVWFNRPDLREDGLDGYGFGSPRCYWGFTIKPALKERWRTFHVVRNEADIVTHLPPVLFGFRHINDVIKVHSGVKHLIKSHKWREYEKGLKLLAEAEVTNKEGGKR